MGSTDRRKGDEPGRCLWTRRRFVKAAAGAVGAVPLGLLGSLPGAPGSDKPNIVFILADDLGWPDVGFMGNPVIETPHLDALSRKGVTFTEAYASAANCAPSRASMLTGQYTVRHGIYQFVERKQHPLKSVDTRSHLQAGKVTVAEALRNCGYDCTFIGKWHLGGTGTPTGPIAQGFDRNIGGGRNGSPLRGYHPPYEYPVVRRAPDGGRVREVLSEQKGGRYLTDRFTDEACRLIGEAEDSFFLMLSYHCPHSPLQGKEQLVDKYRRKIPAGSRLEARYAAMVEGLDTNVGRVLSALQAAGLTEETLVVFFSDNGGAPFASSMEPLRGAKRDFYEGGIRVPMVVSWPGVVEPGSRCDVPVNGVDLMPTFLEAAGCGPPPDQVIDGASLMPLLRGEAALTDRPLFWHFPGYVKGSPPVGVVRKGDYKLLEFFEDDHLELYNIRDDIGEQTNLAGQKPEKTREMHDLIVRWRKNVGAPMPRPNPRYQER